MNLNLSKVDTTLLMELFPLLLGFIHITVVLTKVARDKAKEREKEAARNQSKKISNMFGVRFSKLSVQILLKSSLCYRQ